MHPIHNAAVFQSEEKTPFQPLIFRYFRFKLYLFLTFSLVKKKTDRLNDFVCKTPKPTDFEYLSPTRFQRLYRQTLNLGHREHQTTFKRFPNFLCPKSNDFISLPTVERLLLVRNVFHKPLANSFEVLHLLIGQVLRASGFHLSMGQSGTFSGYFYPRAGRAVEHII